MNTIGAYYENSLAQVNQPGQGPNGSDGYYIPDATGSMTCSELQSNLDKIENQILYWYGIIQSGNNGSRELENLNKIINILRSKKDYYNQVMLRNCTTAPTTTVEPEPVVPDYTDPEFDPATVPTTTAPNNNTGLILLAAGGLGLLLLNKKKKGGKKVKGVGEDLLGPVVFTAALIMLSKKNPPAVEVVPPTSTDSLEVLPLPHEQYL